MKFDYIIGNPPYQENDNNSGKGSASPIYDKFVTASKAITPKCLIMITPSVWFTGGKGLDTYRTEMVNDKHFKVIYNFETPQDVFPSVNLRGGVSYFLIDRDYDNTDKGVRVVTIKNKKVIEDDIRPLRLHGADTNLFISSTIAYKLIQRLIDNGDIIFDLNSPKMFSSLVSSRNIYGFTTTVKRDKRVHKKAEGLSNPVKLYASHGNTFFVERDDINKSQESIDCYKVLTPFANNIGTDLSDDNLNTIIAKPGSIATETYLVVGANLNMDEYMANNISTYMQTKFTRFLISLAKANQNGTQKTYAFVPIQDFTHNSDIDWSKSIHEIDLQLYDKYGLDDKEREFVETHVKEMA